MPPEPISPLSRRAVLQKAGALATALATLELVGRRARIPVRKPLAANAGASLPDIQFDIGAFIARPQTIGGLERFITATRRQNLLVPPRQHRAFPLLEFT